MTGHIPRRVQPCSRRTQNGGAQCLALLLLVTLEVPRVLRVRRRHTTQPEGENAPRTEGACGNNAVQFQSCDGSSYCTTIGKSGCTDIVSRQLGNSSIIKRWCAQFSEGESYFHDEDHCSRPSLVTDGKCAGSSFAEPELHNFGNLWSILPDVLLNVLRNCLPLAVDSYDTGI